MKIGDLEVPVWKPKIGDWVRALQNEYEVPVGKVGVVTAIDDDKFYFCMFEEFNHPLMEPAGFPMYASEIAPLSEFHALVYEVLDGDTTTGR